MWKRLVFAIPILLILLPILGLALLSAVSRRPANLGVQAGKLAPCPSSPNCVSSDAESESQRIAPIPLRTSRQVAIEQLQSILKNEPRCRVVEHTEDYLAAEFTSRFFRFVDDVEFLVDEPQQEIHFRSASRAGHSDLGVNRKRMEHLREAFLSLQQQAVDEQTTSVGVDELPPPVSTFSIVAYDPVRQEWGIGVASKFLAVGSVVPWAAADAGAIATQSIANTSYGPRGLEMLRAGRSSEDVLQSLLESDELSRCRQVGIVDLQGHPATFTGSDCQDWAGGQTGEHFACQGNLLTGPEVIDAMAQVYEQSDGPLCWRIMDALQAADDAGGDKRGRQSAALYVVKDQAGYSGFNDRMLDFRVDDHERPLEELARILTLRMPRPESEAE